jgi:hypothetical protein
MVQGTPLVAILLVAAFSSLDQTAKYTLALTITAPLYLLSSMATTELIVGRAEGFQELSVIAAARGILLTLSSGLAILLMLAVWPAKTVDPAFIAIFALVFLAKLFDGVLDTAIQFCRREATFHKVFVCGAVYALSFFGLAILVLSLRPLPPEFGLPFAAAIAPLCSVIFILTWLARTSPIYCANTTMKGFRFAVVHALRGAAYFVNSLQSAAPRFLLEGFASPQYQAAYTILGMFCRAFTLPLQSIFVPLIPSFIARYRVSPARTLTYAFAAFAAIAALIGVGLSTIWLAATALDMVRFINVDLPKYLSPSEGMLVIWASSFYLLRFAFWQLLAMLYTGGPLSLFALVALFTTLISGKVLVPSMLIGGAAAADAAGSLVLIALPLCCLVMCKSFAWLGRP